MRDVDAALGVFEQDDAAIRAVVLTGSEKAFAAGADIKEMASKTFVEPYVQDFITTGWERITTCRKPIIAAVAGFCARRRLRTGDDVRLHHCRRHRAISVSRKSRWALFLAPAARSA